MQQALVLQKMQAKGLRLHGRALQRTAASGSLLSGSVATPVGALRRTMRMLCGGIVFHQRRDVHWLVELKLAWATCFMTVLALHKTSQRP